MQFEYFEQRPLLPYRSVRGKTERGFDFLGYHFEPEEISPP
jgi:hypothetical protein